MKKEEKKGEEVTQKLAFLYHFLSIHLSFEPSIVYLLHLWSFVMVPVHFKGLLQVLKEMQKSCITNGQWHTQESGGLKLINKFYKILT